ncbi:tetratricopeptide repeat protein [Streptomyces sp. NPDC127066]|uniref:tetratricopeptide repeat protein n=1 Tax=Streptomyces sp. NPDC127066 TaxID=3347125 RepID=UPI0036664183
MEFLARPWWAYSRMSRSDAVALDRLGDLVKAGDYEQAEAGARVLAAAPRRLRRRNPLTVWHARALATAAAVAHGRGAEVLTELEALIGELESAVGVDPGLPLVVRGNRVVVLIHQSRYAEAEAEANAILRAATRIAHLTEVWRIELSTLDDLADAMCGQGRYAEAEAIARGNLPRAVGGTAVALQCQLVRSLTGQGRHEEALTEARRHRSIWVREKSGVLDIAIATALHGLGRRSEAESAARRALTDCERFLHPTHPRIHEARELAARTAGEDLA